MNIEFLKKNFDAFVSKIKTDEVGKLSEEHISNLLSLFGLTIESTVAFDYTHCAYNLVHNPTMQILYASKGYESLTGYTLDELNKTNMMFFLSRIHQDDISIMNEIIKLEMELFQQTDPRLLNKSKMSHNFRFVKKDGTVVVLLNHIHHLFRENQSEPEYSLTLTQDISSLKTGDSVKFEFCLFDEVKKEYTVLKRKDFCHTSIYTDRELDIVRLSASGDTNKLIADKLKISEQTVKNYKYQLFRKANVKNMAEMINLAKGKGLL